VQTPKAFFMGLTDFKIDIVRAWRMVRACLHLLPMAAAATVAQAGGVDSAQACRVVWAVVGAPTGRDALLVVLSPRMPYALQEWPRMRDAATAEGFQVIASRDPRVPLPEWDAAVVASGRADLTTAPAVDADAAARCGLFNHFPSALVGRCGQVHSWPVLGVMPDAAWLEVLRRRRESMPCA